MRVIHHPRVGVVIATRNRPQLLRLALASVLEQRYAGPVEVVLVFDRSEPDHSLARSDPQRTVRIMVNERIPGLAGARNTGILSLDTELIAFCDDDDTWLADKLSAQVDRLATDASIQFVTTAMRVDYRGQTTVRLAGRDEVTVSDMARSRMSMLHSSSFLFRRDAMLGPEGFGLVDETIPRSMAEDWDLLLRATRRRPVSHIDRPFVNVVWGQSSYFNEAWADKNAASEWLIDHHAEIRGDPKALGLQLGKLAFGHAALRERRAAVRAVRRAVRVNWREPRTVIAIGVLLGMSPAWIVNTLNKRGHGI